MCHDIKIMEMLQVLLQRMIPRSVLCIILMEDYIMLYFLRFIRYYWNFQEVHEHQISYLAVSNGNSRKFVSKYSSEIFWQIVPLFIIIWLLMLPFFKYLNIYFESVTSSGQIKWTLGRLVKSLETEHGLDSTCFKFNAK